MDEQKARTAKYNNLTQDQKNALELPCTWNHEHNCWQYCTVLESSGWGQKTLLVEVMHTGAIESTSVAGLRNFYLSRRRTGERII